VGQHQVPHVLGAVGVVVVDLGQQVAGRHRVGARGGGAEDGPGGLGRQHHGQGRPGGALAQVGGHLVAAVEHQHHLEHRVGAGLERGQGGIDIVRPLGHQHRAHRGQGAARGDAAPAEAAHRLTALSDRALLPGPTRPRARERRDHLGREHLAQCLPQVPGQRLRREHSAGRRDGGHRPGSGRRGAGWAPVRSRRRLHRDGEHRAQGRRHGGRLPQHVQRGTADVQCGAGRAEGEPPGGAGGQEVDDAEAVDGVARGQVQARRRRGGRVRGQRRVPQQRCGGLPRLCQLLPEGAAGGDCGPTRGPRRRERPGQRQQAAHERGGVGGCAPRHDVEPRPRPVDTEVGDARRRP
jgi:hypothetical protein